MQTDNAGLIPEVGDYVAYNRSGQIATGYIVSTGRSKFAPIYRIQIVLPKRDEGKQSIVRGGPRCLLVLDKA